MNRYSNKNDAGNPVFTRAERIANVLVLNSTFIKDPGLMNGKAGVALFLHHIARRQGGKSVFREFASDFMSDVVEALHEGMKPDFANGLTGIGWTVDYLLHHGFEEGDADELLEDIDLRISSEAAGEQTAEIISGALIYLCARLDHAPASRTPEVTQRLEQALAEWVSKLNAVSGGLTPEPVTGYDDTLFWLGRSSDRIERMKIPGIKISPLASRRVEDFASLANSGSLSAHNGVSGRILMQKFFGEEMFPDRDLVRTLENMPETSSSVFAGYDMKGVNYPLGLMNGLAGIGLAIVL